MADPKSVSESDSAGSASALPLTLLDEAILHFQDARSQWNVQFELGTDRHLEEARLRQAVLACCRRHPLARARLAPWKKLDSSYQWEVMDELDLDPVRAANCPDEAALERIRAELYNPPLELDTAPVLRIVLARRPDGDLVLMSVSHLIADGVGAVRLMQTISRVYRGEPDPPDPLPLAQARDLGSFLAPRNRSEKRARHLEGLRRLREALDAPSRIAVVGGDRDGDGYGFVCRSLDIGETTTPALVQRAAGMTINDVLLAALHLTVQAWNTDHEVSTDRVGVLMPVNIRPAERFWEVVSNFTSLVTVSTSPEDRADLATATEAVAEQTKQFRREDRAFGLYDLLDATKKAPVLVKRAIPRMLPYTGDRFMDTVMLSNLGRIPEPPTFAAEPDPPVPELWFSPPCDPACGAAIGVATIGDRLTLVTRYRQDQFDAGAAAEFTDLLISHLTGHRGHAGRE
ncbi:MAG: condensation domain-containing protein [Pseudonocardiaceae bacterium]